MRPLNFLYSIFTLLLSGAVLSCSMDYRTESTKISDDLNHPERIRKEDVVSDLFGLLKAIDLKSGALVLDQTSLPLGTLKSSLNQKYPEVLQTLKEVSKDDQQIISGNGIELTFKMTNDEMSLKSIKTELGLTAKYGEQTVFTSGDQTKVSIDSPSDEFKALKIGDNSDVSALALEDLGSAIEGMISNDEQGEPSTIYHSLVRESESSTPSLDLYRIDTNAESAKKISLSVKNQKLVSVRSEIFKNPLDLKSLNAIGEAIAHPTQGLGGFQLGDLFLISSSELIKPQYISRTDAFDDENNPIYPESSSEKLLESQASLPSTAEETKRSVSQLKIGETLLSLTSSSLNIEIEGDKYEIYFVSQIESSTSLGGIYGLCDTTDRLVEIKMEKTKVLEFFSDMDGCFSESDHGLTFSKQGLSIKFSAEDRVQTFQNYFSEDEISKFIETVGNEQSRLEQRIDFQKE